MKRLFSFLMTLTLSTCLGAPVFAQGLPVPLLRGPQDPSQTQVVLNNLINQINGVLVPALGATTTPAGTAVNTIALTGGVTGSNAQIGLQPGADANAGIQINPNGSGNIVLFGQGDTGSLQFGNSTAFVPATGFAACPGVIPNAAPMGVRGTITSYIIVKDWMGNSHGWATC